MGQDMRDYVDLEARRQHKSQIPTTSTHRRHRRVYRTTPQSGASWRSIYRFRSWRRRMYCGLTGALAVSDDYERGEAMERLHDRLDEVLEQNRLLSSA